MITFNAPEKHEITYLEADVNYTIFHLSNGKKVVSSSTLKKYAEDAHMSDFLRVHKSFLLNPNYITHFTQEGKTGLIKLSTGKLLRVSRRRMTMVKRQMISRSIL
ncbi:LytTr DNA-binding region [Emticicia oligotrophica DSM 17448]|uniref:LytTr DNA-binding region n=1 Tax=Emticicia oligotrophica (strain DSM 17448 / CIP 109782 / MTCC 6937 / GPTSA100-15) TaxID=929562 RepID=A0ABN4ANU6_EMTOG|nr:MULTISPECIES: LytTR family DNA-binding domain-containing protein [Emticicia]AFK03994.1 LytTr DNA-binding region [Emticicia oligotrophica DSM 17448]